MRLNRAKSGLVSKGMVGLLVWGWLILNASAEATSGFEGYRTQEIHGWTVHVSEEVDVSGGELGEQLLEVLKKKLKFVSENLPERRMKFLKGVVLWVEFDDQEASPIVYHRSDEWLRRRGKNPAKVGGIEISNVRQALFRIKRQPMVILHELSHAYHHQELGLDDKIVIDAYDGAMAAGLYQQVKKGKGSELVTAYAAKNSEEYFAELSEAYFGTNDYFPFSREELKKYDPDGYLMISRLWLLR